MAYFPLASISQAAVVERRVWTDSVRRSYLAARMLIVAAIAAQFIDLGTTALGVVAGKAEINPLTASVIAHYGFAGLFLEKTIVAGVIAYNVMRLPYRWAIVTAALSTLITGAVIISNLRFIL
jgi:hypothetical protein